MLATGDQTDLAVAGDKMAKKKNEDEIDRLEEQIRELKSINRSLMKRLKKVDRHYKDVINEREEDSDTEKERTKRTCSHCERGELTEVNLLGRVFERCTVCDWRSKTKKT